MVHRPITISGIAYVLVAGILLLGVLTTIPANNHAFAANTKGAELLVANTTAAAAPAANTTAAHAPAANTTAAAAPAANTTAAAAPAANTTAADVNTILQIHNSERAAVGVQPLVWSDKLAADAKSWADHLASLPPLPPDDGWTSLGGKPQLVHAASGEGENLWAGGANFFSTAHMVQSWVSEKNNWNGGTFPSGCASGKVCDHYTQMVWRTTTNVGCATAIGNQGKFEFLVCRYSPPGNMAEEKPF